MVEAILPTVGDTRLTKLQNFVWCVNNKITGITIAIYYNESDAYIMASENADLFVKRMLIE